jgi:hypothetical protein
VLFRSLAFDRCAKRDYNSACSNIVGVDGGAGRPVRLWIKGV